MKSIITFFLFMPILAFSQFTNYTTNDGLISNFVQCVHEDNSGNVWVGTSYGLSFFDGTNFTNYTTSNGLVSDNVKVLEIADNGKLWIGTDAGVSVFNGFTFTNYTTADGLIYNSINDIQCDTAGNIWIVTNSGISVYNGFTFINYTIANGLPSNTIKQVEMDEIGTIWLGTSAGLVRYFNPGFTTFTTADGLPINSISILTAKDKVYMGAGGGRFCVFDGNTFDLYDDTYGFPTALLKSIAIDDNYNIWLANSSALMKYDYSTIETYSATNSILSGGLTSVYINQNQLYVTSGNGYYTAISGNQINLISDTLNINNIGALISSDGYLYNRHNGINYFEVPIGSGKMSNYAASIWLGGIDQNNIFHMAAGRFAGISDWDWDTGPITNQYNSLTYDSLYKRVWKINKSEIDYHKQHWSDTGYIVSPSLLSWPDIANYVDSNLNGIYDPANGDYPEIMGDQAILSIFNDTVLGGTIGRHKMGVEVHALVYGYDTPSDSDLYNTIFTQYKIINKSNNHYSDVYLGVYDDIDIGDATDDYIGVDTASNSYYIYNGDANDDDYGTHIPAQSVTFLSSKMTSATYFSNGTGPTSDPQTPLEYYNLLNGYWKDGSPYTYGGNGYGGTTPVNYVFSGDPVYTSTWNEAYVGNTPGDRRGVGIVGPFTLDAGQEICIDVAFCNAIAYNGNNLLSVKYLLSRTLHIQWWKSNHPGISCDSIITLQQNDLHLFAQDSAYCPGNSEITLSAIHTGGVYPFTYEWTDSSGMVFSYDQEPTIPLPSSTISYFVTLTDSVGNSVTDTLTIDIHPAPTLNLGTYSNLCIGDTVTIDISGFNSYHWSNGNTTPIVHLTQPGNYIVTVTDNNGCQAVDTTSLSFTPNTLNLNDITPDCIGDNVTIDAGSGFSSYLWNTSSTSQSISITPSSPGQTTYYVTVTTINGCMFTDSTTLDVHVPSLFLGNDTLILSNQTLTINPGSYQDYLWSNASTYPSYVFDGAIGAGIYPVWLETTDYYGCTASDTIIITVEYPVGISGYNFDQIKVFPNPAKDKIIIENDIKKQLPYCLFDENGKKVVEGTLRNKYSSVSMENLAPGKYLFKVAKINYSIVIVKIKY